MCEDCHDSQGICKTWHQTWNIIAISTMHHTTQCQHSNFLAELVLEDSGQRLNAARILGNACMHEGGAVEPWKWSVQDSIDP